MALTLKDFLKSFPEFDEVSHDERDLVLAKLAEAESLIDRSVYASNADTAVKYMAAHLIAISPCGQSAGLSGEHGTSAYRPLLKHLKRTAAAVGVRVI